MTKTVTKGKDGKEEEEEHEDDLEKLCLEGGEGLAGDPVEGGGGGDELHEGELRAQARLPGVHLAWGWKSPIEDPRPTLLGVRLLHGELGPLAGGGSSCLGAGSQDIARLLLTPVCQVLACQIEIAFQLRKFSLWVCT